MVRSIIYLLNLFILTSTTSTRLRVCWASFLKRAPEHCMWEIDLFLVQKLSNQLMQRALQSNWVTFMSSVIQHRTIVLFCFVFLNKRFKLCKIIHNDQSDIFTVIIYRFSLLTSVSMIVWHPLAMPREQKLHNLNQPIPPLSSAGVTSQWQQAEEGIPWPSSLSLSRSWGIWRNSQTTWHIYYSSF